MPSLRKRKSETKTRNTGTPKRQKSTGRTTRSRSAGRASTPSRRSTRSPPARLQPTKEEEVFENGDYVDPDLVDEDGDFEGSKPEEPYVDNELLDDAEPVAESSGRNAIPSEPKKLSCLSPLWSIVLLLVLALDIPLCRMQYNLSVKEITDAKTEFFKDVNETIVCPQMFNKKAPPSVQPGWTEDCIELCNKASELHKMSESAKIQARKDHPIGNIVVMIMEKLQWETKSPTPSCSEVIEAVDDTNKTADILIALLALTLVFVFLNVGTSLASKGIIHPNLVTVLSVVLNVSAFVAFLGTYYYYYDGDMASSTIALSKAALYACPTMWVLMCSASYLSK